MLKCLIYVLAGFSQNFDNLIADLINGTLTGITPGDNMGMRKNQLPWFTGETEEGRGNY